MVSNEVRQEFGLKPRYVSEDQLRRYDSFLGCLQLASKLNQDKKDGLQLISPYSQSVIPFSIPEQSEAFWHIVLDHPNQVGGCEALIPNFRTIIQNYIDFEQDGFNTFYYPTSTYQFPYYAFDVLASFKGNAKVRQRIYLSNIVNGDREFQVRIIRILGIARRRDSERGVKVNRSGLTYPSTCYVVDKLPVSPEQEITEVEFRTIFARNKYDWVSPVPGLALQLERQMSMLLVVQATLLELPLRFKHRVMQILNPKYMDAIAEEKEMIRGFDKPTRTKLAQMLITRRNK